MESDKTNKELYDELVMLRQELKENTLLNNRLLEMLEENTKLEKDLLELLEVNTKYSSDAKKYSEINLSTDQQWKNFGLNILANIAGNTIQSPTLLKL